MQAVAPAMGSHDLLANAHRGRHRSTSEVFPPPERDVESVQLPKAASYTYFPRVKDLDDPTVLELKGTISEDELKNGAHSGTGTPSDSSGGSSPDSEEAPQEERMPQLRPSNSRRSSRFLPFSTKAREPSEERKTRSSRPEPRKAADSPSKSPARSLSMLRRKSWIPSPSRGTSPTKEKENQVKVEEVERSSVTEASNRTSLTSALSIPEKARVRDVTHKDTTPEGSVAKSRVLTKKSKRLSFFNSSTGPQDPPAVAAPKNPAVPSLPALPKSFSTDRLPSFSQPPPTPTHIPPLPHNLSSEKFKGGRTEPRKKDELWTVFRTLEGDLRK